jgi:agmatine deiminase
MKRRLPAEWEPQSAVQFTFPHANSDWAEDLERVAPCFAECIAAVSRFENVLVVCHSIAEVKPLLHKARQENLILVELPSNDTWARDHGGITILENGIPVILDFMFNGWGLKFPANHDNLITGRLSRKGIFRASLRRPGLVLEGGAIESDGEGTLLTTSQCLLSPNRNPHLSKSRIERRLRNLFGLERMLWLNNGYLAGDDTDSHIDTLARFCNPETIAYVKCSNPKDEHFEALGKMEQELKSFRTWKGKPYRLVPLPLPHVLHPRDGYRLPATYANFLIINGAVLVPLYGTGEDRQALEQLQSCFPEREIIGIDCSPLILQHGSLHCISMQFPEGVVDLLTG